MAGRKRKPIPIRALTGNPGHRPIPESVEFSGTPVCPDWLDDDARREWGRIVNAIAEVDLLRAVDSAVLESYCVGYARWVQSERDIAHNGTVIPYVIHNRDGSTQTKLVKNPSLSVSSDVQKQMLRAGSLLGFNPVDRSKVAAPPKRERNPFLNDDDE